MKERREIECAGCMQYKPVDGGYFMNAIINRGTGVLAITQVKTSRRFDHRGFEHFVCGDECAKGFHGKLMKKMSGDVGASPDGPAVVDQSSQAERSAA